MAVETQELQLIVNAVDNATPVLIKTRRELEDFGKHAKRVSEQASGSIGESLKGITKFASQITGLPLAEFTKIASEATKGVGGFTTALAAVPLAMWAVNESLTEFAERMSGLKVQAGSIGIATGEFEALTKQLQAMGLSSEGAKRNITGLMTFVAQAQRMGTKENLFIRTQLPDPGNVFEQLRKVSGLPAAEQTKFITQLFQRSEAKRAAELEPGFERSGLPPEQARQAAKTRAATDIEQITRGFGLNAEWRKIKPEDIQKITQQQIEDAEKRVKAGEDIDKTLGDLGDAVEKWKDKILLKILPEMDLFLEGLTAFVTNAPWVALGVSMYAAIKALGAIPTGLKALFPGLAGGAAAAGAGGAAEAGAAGAVAAGGLGPVIALTVAVYTLKQKLDEMTGAKPYAPPPPGFTYGPLGEAWPLHEEEKPGDKPEVPKVQPRGKSSRDILREQFNKEREELGLPKLGESDVPKFQHGGIVRRPMMGLLGEAGPEAVIPLSAMGGEDASREQRKLLRENTEELRRLNDFLTKPEERAGAAKARAAGAATGGRARIAEALGIGGGADAIRLDGGGAGGAGGLGDLLGGLMGAGGGAGGGLGGILGGLMGGGGGGGLGGILGGLMGGGGAGGGGLGGILGGLMGAGGGASGGLGGLIGGLGGGGLGGILRSITGGGMGGLGGVLGGGGRGIPGGQRSASRPRSVRPDGSDDATPPASGGATNLADDRARFRKELAEKPWLREKLLGIGAGENRDPQANQAVFEETLNRASVSGHSLEHEARTTKEGGYYEGYNPGALNNQAFRAASEKRLDAALAGSNVSNFATDNSSGSLAQREAGSGRFIEQFTSGGEHFFSPGTSGNFSRSKWSAWRQRMLAGAKPGGGGVASAGTGPGSGLRPGAIGLTGGRDTPYEDIPGWIKKVDSGGPGLPGEKLTAEKAGIKPDFPVRAGVNWQNLDAEYLSRMNAAYKAMPDSEKKNFEMISGYRPATREEARRLGMSESSSQEDIWERSGHGTKFAAAPPGHSAHQLGQAGDYTKTDWLRAHGPQYGLTGLYHKGSGAAFDYPHIQEVPGGRSFLDPQIARLSRDGSALDRTHRIEGSANIDVNVNAPAGTNVRANADGLFKKTRLTRQTQMPLLEAGASTPASIV